MIGVILTLGASFASGTSYERERLAVFAAGAFYTELFGTVAIVTLYLWFGMTWQLLPRSRQVAEHGRPISPRMVWGLLLVPILNLFFTWYLAKQIRYAYNEMVEEYRRTHRIKRLPMQLAFGLPLVGALLAAMAVLTVEEPLLCRGFLGAAAFTLLSAFGALSHFMFAVDKAKGLIAVAAPGTADVLS